MTFHPSGSVEGAETGNVMGTTGASSDDTNGNLGAERVRESHTDRLTILTVCTANICRSPLMELLLRASIDTSSYEVGSAGIRGFTESAMDPDAAKQAVRFGADPQYFKSRPIDAGIIELSGLILTATRDQRSHVLSEDPKAMRRTFTLLEFAELLSEAEGDSVTELIADAARLRSHATGELDIEDPYRKGELVHQQIAECINTAINTIVTRLNAVAEMHTAS